MRYFLKNYRYIIPFRDGIIPQNRVKTAEETKISDGYYEVSEDVFNYYRQHRRDPMEEILLMRRIEPWEKMTYDEYVDHLIRQKYSISAEFAIIRQKDKKAAEWEEYDNFCEECKAEAAKHYKDTDTK